MDSFEIVRQWFLALNCQDVDALVAFYHDDCFNEQGPEIWRGLTEQRLGYERMMTTLSGAFEGDVRRKVRSIGRIETGARIRIGLPGPEKDAASERRQREDYGDE